MDQQRIYKSFEEFCALQAEWIQLEHEEEKKFIQQLLNDNNSAQIISLGYGIGKMRLIKSKINIIRRQLLIFEYHQESCRLKQGDQVGVYRWGDVSDKFKKPPYIGVVERFKQDRIRIMLEKDQQMNDEDGLFAIALQENYVTYKRHMQVIKQLKLEFDKNPLIKAAFEEYQFRQPKEWQFVGNTWSELNDSQIKAIENALSQQYMALIHGPPGTGKTRTVCEFIKQTVKLENSKVLACAPSNIAVDNMIERLAQICKNEKIKYCRVGNPARTMDSVKSSCIDVLAKKTESYAICKEIKMQIQQLERKIIKAEYKEKKQLRAEKSQLQKDLSLQEEMMQFEVIQDCQVVFSTNTGCGQGLFKHLTKKINFDVVVIDECAQSLEISCWISLLKGRKMVLAGDHQQLPPTIKSRCQGLEMTLFQRIQQETNSKFSTLLRIQYRMNKQIMDWSSKQFYEGQLVAHESVCNHTTNDLSQEQQEMPIILAYIDTAGCNMYEEEVVNLVIDDQNKSKFNLGECGLVEVVVDELKLLGIQPQDIGVIAPYNAQVQMLRKKLTDVEISTVDGFQGREKECIIISMVRSNDEKQVGFLCESRRMNVAVTRAKRFVCLIGDSDTVNNDKMLKEMIQYFSDNGDLRNAQMYADDERVHIGMKPQKQKQQKNKQKPIEKLAQSTDEKLMQVQKSIEEFIKSDQQEIVFKKQNAYQRKWLHELAEKYNLNHKSVGEGSQKTMTISKVKLQPTSNSLGIIQDEPQLLNEQIVNQFEMKKEIEQIDNNNNDDQDQDCKEILVNKDKSQVLLDQTQDQGINQSKIYQNNQSQLKNDNDKKNIEQQQQLQQQQQQQQQDKAQQNIQNQQKKDQQKQKQKKQKQQQLTQSEKQKEEDDFYNSITILDPQRCACFINGRQCGKPNNLLSIQCKYCQKKYCGMHNLAEEHGCDIAAQQDARSAFLKQSQLRGQNEKSIGEKLKEAQEKRKPKKKQ